MAMARRDRMRGGHDEARPAAAPDLHAGSRWRTRSRCQRGDLGPTAFFPARLLQDVGRLRSCAVAVTLVEIARHWAWYWRGPVVTLPSRRGGCRRTVSIVRRPHAWSGCGVEAVAHCAAELCGAGSAGVRSFHQRMSTCARRRWRWHQFPLAPVVPVPRVVPVGGCAAVSGRRAGGRLSCRVPRPARSGAVGRRGSRIGCRAVSGLYTLAGFPSGNLPGVGWRRSASERASDGSAVHGA